MLLRELISILDAHDVNIMLTITVQDFVKFLCVAADMAMRSEKSLRLTTLRRPIRYLAASLPPPIHQYLEVFWDASFNILKDCYINAQHHVKTHGIMTELDDGRLPIRIVDQSLFPPVEHCTKCSRTMRSSSLFGYLYDVDGCHTIEHFSLYCQPCLTNYYVSYSIYNKQRMFYTSSQGRDPKVFQVHTHYFMTHRLAHHFKMSQMLQQCSVFSIINLYNSTFMGARAPPLFTPLQSFFPQLSVEVCKDGMDIDTLIYNYSLRSQVLVVPAAGLDRVRYNEAKKQCSSWIAAEGTAHKNHSCSLYESGEVEDWESLQQADELDRAEESIRSGEERPSKKPTLARARTHNDQLAVAPCGVILARQTMFNSESPSAVKLFLLDTFPTSMLQVILYDSACKLLAHIYKSTAEERDRFTESIVAVDAFHFKSHKEDDCFCRKWTDPNLYPQLKKDGSWIFNSSAAEIANIWYGGFASICRNMTAIQYNFFLDEMLLQNYVATIHMRFNFTKMYTDVTNDLKQGAWLTDSQKLEFRLPNAPDVRATVELTSQFGRPDGF
ncbi:hypothetical protein PSTG_12354 [Puccinia striiformis f. sp. tritici PST-78]|uniref:CxC5 like cysteine cluster associated with KDZ domain-containing protein n=1 Tax=Puccinia striiformis f. sp. tritici PST-78 TaxID=1165861 RepID=A0A0L0V5N7_9BASI|nr:hypothetical protein PSTG_12354 [Puccinia striiformis f. sp. tritici PST-78]